MPLAKSQNSNKSQYQNLNVQNRFRLPYGQVLKFDF